MLNPLSPRNKRGICWRFYGNTNSDFISVILDQSIRYSLDQTTKLRH